MSRTEFIPLWVGDTLTDDHVAMLTTAGFAHTDRGLVQQFTGPEEDGRILLITVEGARIITEITISGMPTAVITLTPLEGESQ